MANADDPRVATCSGRPPVVSAGPTPDPETLPNGQHRDYWVLSEAERARGFVRPVRRRYRHVGHGGPRHPVRELTPEEQALYQREGYVRFEAYPESEYPVTGRFWTQAQLDRAEGCGSVTTMAQPLAETYAREPGFYGSTFCCACGGHFPVGEHGEFVWDGTEQRVGT